MPQQRSRLDHDHPCLACGRPWRTTEQAVRGTDRAQPVAWFDVRSDCGGECYRWDLEAYSAAREERRRRDW